MYFTKCLRLTKLTQEISKGCVRRYTPRRALMYVPGDDTRKLSKAFKIDVDCIAMDCEDGVATNRKEAARDTIRKLLDAGKPMKSRYFDWAVRINSVDSGLCKDDLSYVLSGANLPDTVLFPKVDTVDHLKWFSDEVNRNVKNGQFELVIYIESALAFLNIIDICKAAKELSKTSKFVPTALLFGSDDLCASIGATRTESSNEILYARQKMVLVAKAFQLQAIDMVYIQYKDFDGLKKQSEEGARMGYTGKQVIHPNQVPVVQEAFLPSQQQVEWANELLTAFEDHQKSGKGAYTYKGSMIDMPTIKQARNIIELIKSV